MKINFRSFFYPSFPRRLESNLASPATVESWIPAFAGMTKLGDERNTFEQGLLN
jgi:hypothetical protein